MDSSGTGRRLKILVSGYYGFRNAGDEAILYALIQELRARQPAVDIVVLSAAPEETSRIFAVRAIPRMDWGVIRREIRGADLFISGGGGLLQDSTSLASLQYYLGLMALARIYRCPVFLYAQGVGPINSKLGQMLTALVLNRVQSITLRDNASFALLRKWGVRRPPMKVTADPVLGLEIQNEWLNQGRNILKTAGLTAEPLVGISVRFCADFDRYMSVVAQIADELIQAGYQVAFIPFQHPQDLDAARRVIQQMQYAPVLLEQPLDFAELLGVCAQLQLAIGMRLHFLVFAALAGVPFVGLSYDPKVGQLLQRLGIPDDVRVEELAVQNIRRAAEAVLAHQGSIGEILETSLAELRSLAKTTPSLALRVAKPGHKPGSM